MRKFEKSKTLIERRIHYEDDCRPYLQKGGGKNLNYLLVAIFTVAMCAAMPSFAATNFDVANGSTVTYTFGSPVGDGETAYANIDSPETFAFRSGTVNVKTGGSIKTGGGNSSNYSYGNWLGSGSNTATLNINGGTFWSYAATSDGTHSPYGRLRIGVNSGENDSVLNLISGTLKVDSRIDIGGTTYNQNTATAKNGTVNISGGTATVQRLYLGATASGTYANATLNLTGGTLEVSQFYVRRT